MAVNTKFRPHCQGGEPYVDPVEEGNYVEQQDEGQNPDLHLPVYYRLDGLALLFFVVNHGYR